MSHVTHPGPKPVGQRLASADLTSDNCHHTWKRQMIASFKGRRLRRLYETGDRSRVAPEQVEKIENILARLEAADTVEDMDLPGLRLHPLKGHLRGFWSVTVRANWRIILRFEDGAALDVELIDHH